MNKFTFIVEKDENKLTPEQELENAWNDHFQNKTVEQILADPNHMTEVFNFYHNIRNKGYDHQIIFNFLNKKTNGKIK
jgi:hypothetical protein